MTLPSWNDEWEKPDRLKGKRGWTLPDYVNIGVAAFIVANAFALVVPAVARGRETESFVARQDKHRELYFRLTNIGLWPDAGEFSDEIGNIIFEEK